MATYDRSELQITRIEFRVPAPAPWGAAWVEVQKAISVATQELRESGVLGPDQTPSDDQISIAPGDDCVIVSYENRVRTASA